MHAGPGMMPGWRDVLFVALSGGFVALGLLLLWREPGKAPLALGVTSFFAVALVAAVVSLVEKRRFAAHARAPGTVSLVGGVPIRIRRGRYHALGVALVIAGTLNLWTAYEGLGWLYGACVLVMAGAGVALLTGVLPRNLTGWIRFEPDGLRIGADAGEWLVRWDEIVAAAPASFHDNPVLLLGLDLPRVLHRIRSESPGTAAAVERQIGHTSGWAGAHVAIMTWPLGLDLAYLHRAVARYATEPEARAELVSRPLLSA